MYPVVEKLNLLRIIPVIAIDHAKDAMPLADALLEGGLPCAEITFRTDAAEESIRKIAKRGDILVGAGTVLKEEQVVLAMEAGASFIVSPGFNSKVVEYCVLHDIPVIPGISNPTDIELALNFNLKTVKFFPAEAFGGLATLKAISAPYGMMKYIPTGGISIQNLKEYLAFPKVIACGGSWMVKPEYIAAKEFDKITQLTRQAVEAAAQV